MITIRVRTYSLARNAADTMSGRRGPPPNLRLSHRQSEEAQERLFCLTEEYTPPALNAMRENPNTDRRAAVEQLLAAAGGKLIAMYGRASNGPGAMVIFDVPDPAMAPAMVGVALSSGSVQNVELTRLFTMEEITDIRQKARQIYGAYKPPGQR